LRQLDLTQLSKLAREQLHREALKALARTDIFAFGEFVFGYEAYAHHRRMVSHIERAIESKRSSIILLPRGGAKTTWGNTIFLAKYIADHPDVRIGLVSNTARQANDFSRAIKWTFESNPAFRDLYGNLVSTAKWTDVEWLRAKHPRHYEFWQTHKNQWPEMLPSVSQLKEIRSMLQNALILT